MKMTMSSIWGRVGLVVVTVAMMATGMGCTDKNAGQSIMLVDPGSGDPEGPGIESQEIVAMTDKMVVEILAIPRFKNSPTPPKIIVDSEYFKNESDSRINLNTLTDRLRVQLLRASNGRLEFVSRENLGMKVGEDDMRIYSGGSAEGVAATADYRLSGRITSQSTMGHRSGTQSRYHLIVFELIDTRNTRIVWANQYEFKKTGTMDGAYR